MIQPGILHTAGLDSLVRDETQQNRVGPPWLRPDTVQERHAALLGPGEEARDDGGALSAVMEARD